MKRTYILLLLSLLFNCAFAQNIVRSISDGISTINYTDISDAENKLLNIADNQSNKIGSISKLFANLIINDERCFSYLFEKLVNNSHRFFSRPLRIVTSDDNKLRFYTWDEDGGTMSCYSGITSLKGNDGVKSYVSLCNPNDFDDIDDNIGQYAYGVSDILTLKQNLETTIYIIKSGWSGSTIWLGKGLTSFIVNNDLLELYPIFRMGNEIVSSIDWTYPTISYLPLEDFDILNSEMFVFPGVRETNDNAFIATGYGNKYCFDGKVFTYDGICYESSTYKQLNNFEENVIVLKNNKWIFRIDKMSNGLYRYASWKNKEMNAKPDLLIESGYRISNDNEQRYLFKNNEYSYEVSWKFQNGLEHHGIENWKVIVKRNDEVILSILN